MLAITLSKDPCSGGQLKWALLFTQKPINAPQTEMAPSRVLFSGLKGHAAATHFGGSRPSRLVKARFFWVDGWMNNTFHHD